MKYILYTEILLAMWTKPKCRISTTLCAMPQCHVVVSFFVCFVYVEFIVPLENFSLIWRRNHCRWWAANFELCSALMDFEQWGFFNVQHLLLHRPPLYNGHLRGSVTLTPVTERLAVELPLLVFTSQVCRDQGSNPDLPHASECSTSTPPQRSVNFSCGNFKILQLYVVFAGFLQCKLTFLQVSVSETLHTLNFQIDSVCWDYLDSTIFSLET